MSERLLFFHSKLSLRSDRGRFGDISYAKSWCGFPNPRKISTHYLNWRHDVKAYITERAWDPTSLTEDQSASVLEFARALPPLAARLDLLKTEYRKADVDEFERHMKILVKDVGKKLQTTIERRNADPESAGVSEGGRSKHSVHLNSGIVVLKDHLSG